QLLASPWPQRVFRRVKQDVAHVYDESASRTAGLENQIELLPQLLLKGGFLLLGLGAQTVGFVGGQASSLRFGHGGLLLGFGGRARRFQVRPLLRGLRFQPLGLGLSGGPRRFSFATNAGRVGLRGGPGGFSVGAILRSLSGRLLGRYLGLLGLLPAQRFGVGLLLGCQ